MKTAVQKFDKENTHKYVFSSGDLLSMTSPLQTSQIWVPWVPISSRAPVRSMTSILYYMASSVRGQDEPNAMLWLATRAGKMALSSMVWITRCVPQVKHKSFIDQACWVKIVWYWPLPFFVFLDPNSVSGYKHANTHPCWLHTWSIAHISFTRLFSLGSCHRNMQSIPTCTSTW